MEINHCYWFSSIAELFALHPRDFLGDGGGTILAPGDIAFVYDTDGSLLFYALSDVTNDSWMVDDPPFRKYLLFEGEYYVWSMLNLAYTTTAIDIPTVVYSGNSLTGHLYAQQFYQMVRYLQRNPPFGFPFNMSLSAGVYSYTYTNGTPWYLKNELSVTEGCSATPGRFLFFDKLGR